ncbi:MAG: hypothetical protein IH840_14170 [Candidatus Heimdallarchaeota archaeon]|nr:hypothetical protein [Candidatus Heimdallarchaeota archaeon]
MAIEISDTLNIALILLIGQGVMGAFDTLWYHEYRSKLPSNKEAKTELRLHSLRSFIYAIIFGTIAWLEWNGLFVVGLVMLLIAEIIITLMDFVEEDTFRTLEKGERISHALMGIVYGGFLAFFIPELIIWFSNDSGFSRIDYGIYSILLSLMALGVLGSAVRDGLIGFSGNPDASLVQ